VAFAATGSTSLYRLLAIFAVPDSARASVTAAERAAALESALLFELGAELSTHALATASRSGDRWVAAWSVDAGLV
jgi:hypothetical protein